MSSTSDAWAQALVDYKRNGSTPGAVTDLANFDPSQALATYGKAAAGQFQTQFNTDLSALKGSAAGAGRLKTGFYDQDVGRLAQTESNQYQQAIAGQAENAAALKANTLGTAAGYAEDEQNRYLDLLSGQLDRETARQNQIKAEQGSVWGAVGQIAGTAGALLSSEKFKDDVEPIEDATAKLGALPGKRYTYKGDDTPQIGVMAEDASHVAPEAVQNDEHGQPMAVDYQKLVPLVIEATREQAGEIEEIKGVLMQLVQGGKLGAGTPAAPPTMRLPMQQPQMQEAA